MKSEIKEQNEIYKDIIYSVIEDYKATYNTHFPNETLDYNLTLTDQEVDKNKILREMGNENIPEDEDIIKTKYLRLEEVTTRKKVHIPSLEEFIPSFKYQQVNHEKKVWEEKEIIHTLNALETEETEDLIKKQEVRVLINETPKTRLILSKAYPVDEPLTNAPLTGEALLNIIYRDILFLLISTGIEQHAMAAIHREKEQTKNNLKVQENGAEKIETFKSMPKPLSTDDKAYVEWIKKEKEKLKDTLKDKI